MGVNAYFGARGTNIPHATPKYGPWEYNIEVDYYRQIYCYPEKWLISKQKPEKKDKK